MNKTQFLRALLEAYTSQVIDDFVSEDLTSADFIAFNQTIAVITANVNELYDPANAA